MKHYSVIAIAFLTCTSISAIAQTDSAKVKTTTTTTVTTESGTAAKPPAQEQPAPSSSASSGNFSPFYIGFRLMPTLTDIKAKTIDNGVAKTSFVIGYGAGGYLGVNFSEHAALQGEVIYNKLSQKYTDRNLERKLDISYINIPLLLVLNTGVSKPVNLNIAAGPQVGINTGSKLESASGSDGVDTVTAVLAVKSGDLGFAYGAGLDFNLSQSASLGIGYRGVYGLIDISDKSKSTTTNQYYILDRAHVRTYAIYAGLTLKF